METFTRVDPIIRACEINKHVNLQDSQLRILRDISFEIKSGESLAILGPSGAGKTTLLGILAGLDTPSSGKVYLGGVDIFALTEEQRTKVRAKNVSFIFQNFYLLDNLTALENVMLPMELHQVPAARERAIAVLTDVGLGQRLQNFPRQLSGGEQQRVAIARAFALEPAILFADEPTGNLDQVTGEDIINKLFALNKNYHTTLVIVTHDPVLAQRCERSLYIDRGGLRA